MARPEKALLDTLYLTPARSRLFAHLPEVELPASFDEQEAYRWLTKVSLGPRRLAMEQRLSAILGSNHNRRHSASLPTLRSQRH